MIGLFFILRPCIHNLPDLEHSAELIQIIAGTCSKRVRSIEEIYAEIQSILGEDTLIYGIRSGGTEFTDSSNTCKSS